MEVKMTRAPAAAAAQATATAKSRARNTSTRANPKALPETHPPGGSFQGLAGPPVAGPPRRHSRGTLPPGEARSTARHGRQLLILPPPIRTRLRAKGAKSIQTRSAKES